MLKKLMCFFFFFFTLLANGQTEKPFQQEPMKVTRVFEAPVIDGILDEPYWRYATRVADFLQRLPREGATPSESTAVYLMYTPTALYIGVRCYDSHPEDIVATVMQRDNFDVAQNDQFAVAIDSYNDGVNGYWFSTNPLGARVDVQFFNEGDLWEIGWNGTWACRAHTDTIGWTVEMEIPFSTLRFQEGETNIMGINVYRRIVRTNEGIFAPLIPLHYSNGTPNVSIARKYLFEGISGGNSLHIKPYALAGSQKDFLNGSGTETIKEWGLEVRYNLADNLTANVSYNTDFAQVEVDDRQINLTRFNLFVPEKREFFLESAGTFSFGIPGKTELFFSRTVGLAQTSSGSVTPVPLIFGGKISGKLGSANIGILNAQTRDYTGIPGENFSVLRAKQGIAERSYLGMIATNRQNSGSFNRSYGVDGLYYVLNDIGVRGFVAATDNSVGVERRFKNSSASALSLFKQGELTSFDFSITDIGSGFNPGMGYIERGDIRELFASMAVPWYIQTPLILRIGPKYAVQYIHDHNGFIQNYTHLLGGYVTFQSEDEVLLSLSKFYELIPAPFPIFRATSVSPGGYSGFGAELSIITKAGRPLSASLILGVGDLYGGSRKDLSAKIQWKANKHFTIGQEYSTSNISLPGGSFRTHIARSRLAFALNTSFFMNLLAQYDNASDEFGTNLRLRYIFSEGTELFVVFNGVFDEEPASRFVTFKRILTSAVLLKFTYLFDI